jgi:hypothetical protein
MCIPTISNFIFNSIYELRQTELDINTNEPCEILDADLAKSECSISITALRECSIRAKLHCNHHFDAKSILKWITIKKAGNEQTVPCPNCRRNIIYAGIKVYATADKIKTLATFESSRQYCRKKCDELYGADKKSSNETLTDERIAFPLNFRPECYKMKPCLAKIVDTIPFKIFAITFNVLQRITQLGFKAIHGIVRLLLKSCNYVVAVAKIVSIIACNILISPITIPLFIYNKYFSDLPLDVNSFFSGVNYTAKIPIKLFIVKPLKYVSFGLGTILRSLIQILDTKHTPRTIWNDGLLTIPIIPNPVANPAPARNPAP